MLHQRDFLPVDTEKRKGRSHMPKIPGPGPAINTLQGILQSTSIQSLKDQPGSFSMEIDTELSFHQLSFLYGETIDHSYTFKHPKSTQKSI